MSNFGLEGWEVCKIEECPMDCNWRVTLRKGKLWTFRYFYHKVYIGQIVKLSYRD